jgi:DNA-cytosine methyltransferase
MTHASLFSGIGGFDLAAEWVGWNNIFHCEWNPFGQRVLAHHFPNSKSYNDITKTNFSIHAGEIDVLTGGFPCQPYSSAGKRLGKADERHLFPEMLRAINEVKPTWVVGENVLGIVNWGGGWYSTRCKLTWKIKGTKYKRIYFQLVARTLHTKENELGLLPTPTLQDYTNSTFPPSQKKRFHIVGYLMRKGILAHSQLNPQFVEEMMGFPKNWTLLPFLNGETNQSKVTETQ